MCDLDLMVLFMLLREVSTPPIERWEHSLRHYGPGVIDPQLDAMADRALHEFASALHNLQTSLAAFGERVPADWLNARNVTEGVTFQDYPVSALSEAAARLEKLVSITQ